MIWKGSTRARYTVKRTITPGATTRNSYWAFTSRKRNDIKYGVLEQLLNKIYLYLEKLDVAMLFTLVPVILVFYGASREIYIPSYPKVTNDTHTNDKSTNYNTTVTNNTKNTRSRLMPKVMVDPAHDTNTNKSLYAFSK